jgi:vacuolar-type H+-ATPase subunit I/STV1
MSMGIIMKGFNAAYFRRPLDFIFEFIPQIILIIALFGWMDILIIAKWIESKDVNKDYPVTDPKYNEVHLSPPIITTMIDIFLAGASN